MDCFNNGHNTEVHRTSTLYTDVPQYPNSHVTKKVVYEEDEIGGYRGGHVHHHNPEVRERVEVIEYEQVPQYNNRVGEVVYEENVVDVETDRYYPRRNNCGIFRH
ncbi:hypothetical protein TanjilG_15788 [Lupinus angustifolius]|uniref:Phloem specific protein n=1 Tax=Lupinus angustifolius TaxID=3871 RepID=A0A1J7IMA8_LUPAN|nr:PREDICTED: uncharacterized protein LOC109343388 [Lupinus angustifolius]OIW15405.1 hypothetical protein TanjilG_15788 [Lupinus angustifolius]